MEVIERFSIDDVRRAHPRKVFYSALTCWWTHDPAHLSTLGEGGLPCGPRGDVLFETTNVEGFLRSAERNSAHYGRHGLRAFMAAHHSNCVLSLDDTRAWAEREWEAYNDALDRLDERKAAAAGRGE